MGLHLPPGAETRFLKRMIDLPEVREWDPLPGFPMRFFTAQGSEWGTVSNARWVYGVSLLAVLESGEIKPLPLCRVVMRVKKTSQLVLDLVTGADGRTVILPLSLAGIEAGDPFRFEVEAPSALPPKTRVTIVLHGQRQDRV